MLWSKDKAPAPGKPRAFTLVSWSAYSALKIACSSKTSADFRWTTCCYIPEDSTLLSHIALCGTGCHPGTEMFHAHYKINWAMWMNTILKLHMGSLKEGTALGTQHASSFKFWGHKYDECYKWIYIYSLTKFRFSRLYHKELNTIIISLASLEHSRENPETMHNKWLRWSTCSFQWHTE
jgi:hypothetical protein